MFEPERKYRAVCAFHHEYSSTNVYRLDFDGRNLGMSIVYGDGSTELLAHWKEKHGRSGSLSATVAEPEAENAVSTSSKLTPAGIFSLFDSVIFSFS